MATRLALADVTSSVEQQLFSLLKADSPDIGSHGGEVAV
jgi:hypothetical protein